MTVCGQFHDMATSLLGEKIPQYAVEGSLRGLQMHVVVVERETLVPAMK